MLNNGSLNESFHMNMSSLFAVPQTLPHIPRVVQELIDSLNNNNDVDMDDISAKVALDQALTAKVLRLANSAHYGVSRSIATPHDAVVMLGFNTLRTLVLASGVTGAFSTPPGFDQKTFWKDAFAVAALSRWIAQFVPDCDKDTAFTCGMLHSIGELLIRLIMPRESVSVDAAERLGGKRHNLEYALLGFNYAEVGAELARRWKFPDEIQHAIAEQNAPESSQNYSPMAGVLYLARYLKQAHADGLNDDEILAGFPLSVARHIRMNTNRAYAEVARTSDLSSGLDSLLE